MCRHTSGQNFLSINLDGQHRGSAIAGKTLARSASAFGCHTPNSQSPNTCLSLLDPNRLTSCHAAEKRHTSPAVNSAKAIRGSSTLLQLNTRISLASQSRAHDVFRAHGLFTLR